MSAHFQFDPGLGGIHIILSGRGERHKWFDLKTEGYVAATKEMLDVFDRMAKDATERQNEKTREWWKKR
ncbi:hypothetical protein [Neorhizobium sp. T25_27]|uniref:hypothetical protein n=1 Tax=Neorhizobium sp. T25_27 TaxID=2093831 RepID=UPI00197C18D3|nr:hypothetical protein [Neorhizobium sp. T25_27]